MICSGPCTELLQHIGWKFHAARPGLKPERFYGFSGKSIQTKVEMSSVEGEVQRTGEGGEGILVM